MITILLVKSNGDILEKRVKNIDVNNLYKSCGYKTNDKNVFKQVHTYDWKNKKYMVFGKTEGKANSENKYDFPPPIDKCLYFGTMCIVMEENGDYDSLTTKEWSKIYEHMFGGFEDLDNESERSEDSEIYSDEDYTKEGYVKDDFVVDDDELEEEEYIDE
jgi:hypothetical protein